MSSLQPTIRKTTEGSVHLDALRGAAALLVFVNHTRALYFSSVLEGSDFKQQSEAVRSRAETGAPAQQSVNEIKMASEAVVVFFVLSGYLVGGSVLRSLRKAQWSWREYLTKRLTRLYVVLIPAILLGALLDYTGSHLFTNGSAYTVPPGLGLVTTYQLAERLGPLVMLGNALFVEGLLVPHVGSNASLWSLVNEFWYYIAFPLIVLAITSKRSWAVRAMWAAGAVAILAFTGWSIAVLFPVWLLGALVSLLPREFSPRQAKIWSLIFAVILLAGMFGVRLLRVEMVRAEYLIAVLASLLLWALIQQTQHSSGSVYPAVAGFFSRISYTLYLFHLPLALFLSGLLNSPWHQWAKTPKNLAIFIGSDLLIVAIAYGLWRVFENNTDVVRERIFERESRAAS